jgi:hypothetical protein
MTNLAFVRAVVELSMVLSDSLLIDSAIIDLKEGISVDTGSNDVPEAESLNEAISASKDRFELFEEWPPISALELITISRADPPKCKSKAIRAYSIAPSIKQLATVLGRVHFRLPRQTSKDL